MKRVKMFISGVVAVALLCFFSTPMVQAQVGVLADTTHQVKINGSFAGIEDAINPRIERGGGSETAPVVLRSAGANFDTGGFDYEINLLTDTGLGFDCDENTIGTLSTYIGENEAIGVLDIPNFPDPGQTLVGRFFAQVKTKPGKTSFKSVSGWAEIEAGVAFDPIAISKKANVQAKEKTPEKLGLQCTVAVP